MRRTFLTLVLLPILAGTAHAQRWGDWSAPVNLGSVVNTNVVDGCPFISRDELSLYFASPRAGNFDLWVTTRESVTEPWGTPQNLGDTINSDAAELCPTLSGDGHRLYFVSNRDGGCGGDDLYVSVRPNRRDDFGWGPPQHLGCVVNSSVSELSPTLFEDEQGTEYLLFGSNRPGGAGGYDIYQTSRPVGGEFELPAIVIELSSSADDARPNIRKDGREIFFDSTRSGGLGGLDIWTARRESLDAPWEAPVNVTVLNSGAADGRPSLSFHGASLYFMSARTIGGHGAQDLYVTYRQRVTGPPDDR
jgi:Tol biopolymer transport system component